MDPYTAARTGQASIGAQSLVVAFRPLNKLQYRQLKDPQGRSEFQLQLNGRCIGSPESFFFAAFCFDLSSRTDNSNVKSGVLANTVGSRAIRCSQQRRGLGCLPLHIHPVHERLSGAASRSTGGGTQKLRRGLFRT